MSPRGPYVTALLLGSALVLGVALGYLLGRRGRPGPDGGAHAAAAGRPAPQAPAAAPADRGASAPAPQLIVDVLDGAGRPVAGVLLLALSVNEHGRPVGVAQELEPIGELGVLRGPLPYPSQVQEGPPDLGRRAGAGRSAGARNRTDASGSARLAGLRAGRVQVLASHQGLAAAAEVVVSATPGALPPRVVLRLQPPPQALLSPGGEPVAPESADLPAPQPAGPAALLTVAGVVLDERGLPIAGARVEGASGARRSEAVSDGRGRFALAGVAAGAPLNLRVQQRGYAPLRQTLPEPSPTAEALRLQLQPGAGIEGEVRDRRLFGVPAGVRAQLVSGGERRPIDVGRDGRFRATGLPPGETTLRVEAPGYVPVHRTLSLRAADRPDTVTERDLRIELDLGGRLLGQVRGGNGAARGASVRVLDESGVEVGSARADDRGEFRAGPLPAGRLTVLGRAGSESGRETIEVHAGDTARLELELR